MNKKPLGKKSKLGGIAVVVLAGLYSFAAPHLNQRFGWDLPAITSDSSGNVRVADKDPTRSSSPSSMHSPGARETAKETGTKFSPSKSRGPLADRMRTQKSAPHTDSTATPREASASDGEDSTYGILREMGRSRYISPEGLLYTPGSAEGHRLKHVERHTKDAPSRPGSHGVFDGGMEGALKTIDRAYQRAKKNQKTTKKTDDGRTIYTVDMGGRVGFIGGRNGKRKRNPMARRVRLVLDGNRVITAYPL